MSRPATRRRDRRQRDSRRVSMKRFTWLMAVAAVCMLLAACGGKSSSGTSSSGTTSTAPTTTKVSGKLVIDNESGSTWTCQFNPFNSAVLGPGITFALVYEPLEFVNILRSTAPPVPMLATSSQWSNGYKALTFTIRKGVNWSDGKPFGAADVAYTFNAMKTDKAIDLNALWSNAGGPLTSVAVKGADQVVFNFNAPAQTYFYYVADQTPIVPQHIWATLNQSKLSTYSDTH